MKEINDLVEKMSLHEKICQTVILNAFLVGELGKFGNPADVIKENGGMEGFLKKYPVGGMFVGGEVIGTTDQDTVSTRKVVDLNHKVCRIPMLICSDLENGCGCIVNGLTELPHMMALGACNDEELAYKYGLATAIEARSVGIRWSFSPVADLNLNRYNPITNNRSIGDDPQKAKRLLAALVRGMQDGGVAAAAKHFPGDGTDYRDQHLVTTSNLLNYVEWLENHGAVFQTLIDNGLMSIMTGHIAFPDYQKKRVDSRPLPATLSDELTTDLLKNSMGFKGVVVSDALAMGGFIGWYEKSEAEIECFRAGTDMLLWPAFSYIENMKSAISSGQVSKQRLDDAVTRILTMKQKLGLLDSSDPYVPLNDEKIAFVSDTLKQVSEKSITLVKTRNKCLPMKDSDNRILMIGIVEDDGAFDKFSILKNEFEKYGSSVDLRRSVTFDELEAIHGDYERIIYVLYTRPHIPKGPLNFMGDQAAGIWASLSCGVEKSIVISLGSPYFANEYFEAAHVYINVYSNSEGSIKALVKALYGGIPFTGESPVKL